MMKKFFLVLIFFMAFSNLEGQEPLLLSLKQAEDLAIQNNYQLNGSLHLLEQGYYGYRVSKDYFRPSLSASGSLSVTKQGEEQRALDGVVKLTQPIYDKPAFHSLKAAQIQWEQLRLEVQQQICDILFHVREAYYEIILHQAHLAVDQMIIQIWENDLKRQERHLELGASIPYEVNQTKVHLKNAQIDLSATQTDIQKSKIKLLTVLGLPPNTPFNLTETDIPLPQLNCQKKDVDQWKSWAFQYRPQLKKEQFAFLLSQNKIQQAQAERWPTLSLYANVGHRYINNGFDDQPSIGVGVNLDWNLYDPALKHKIKQAREGSRGIASHYYQLELETMADIHQLINEMEQFFQSYAMAKEGALLAEEGMQLASKKQQLGLMSAFEYRDAIKTLHEARQQVNQAKFALRLSYEQLVQQAGIDLVQDEL